MSSVATAGVLFFMQGDKHAARLVVSLLALRKHYAGPVAVVVTNEAAAQIAEHLASDQHMRTAVVDDRGAVPALRNAAYAFKSRLSEVTPFDITVYIDCDTLVRKGIDRLFSFESPEHINLTQFTGWRSSGRTISRRIRQWQDLCPELIDQAVRFGPGFTVDRQRSVWYADRE